MRTKNLNKTITESKVPFVLIDTSGAKATNLKTPKNIRKGEEIRNKHIRRTTNIAKI
ncbi:50S ribosomal protein L23 [Bacillus licheniformis]|nr:hypothetical protein CHCC20487_4374 [Bacillus licheniformis]